MTRCGRVSYPDSVPSLLILTTRKKWKISKKQKTWERNEKSNVYCIVNLSFFPLQPGGPRSFSFAVLLLVISSLPLGRGQSTDARKKGNSTWLMSLLTGQMMQGQQLLSQERKQGSNVQLRKFQSHIKEKLLMTEMNSCPGGGLFQK